MEDPYRKTFSTNKLWRPAAHMRTICGFVIHPSKLCIFYASWGNSHPKNITFLNSTWPLCAKILGDHFRATFGVTPPFWRTPRRRSGKQFHKMATFRTSSIPNFERVYLRATFFVGGSILGQHQNFYELRKSIFTNFRATPCIHRKAAHPNGRVQFRLWDVKKQRKKEKLRPKKAKMRKK